MARPDNSFKNMHSVCVPYACTEPFSVLSFYLPLIWNSVPSYVHSHTNIITNASITFCSLHKGYIFFIPSPEYLFTLLVLLHKLAT